MRPSRTEPDAVHVELLGIFFVSVGFGTLKKRMWHPEDRGEEGGYPTLCGTSHGADARILWHSIDERQRPSDAEDRGTQAGASARRPAQAPVPVQPRSGAEGFVTDLLDADGLAPR